MPITIRRVRPDDLDAVSSIEAQCFPAAEAAERTTLQERIKAFPESFLVAEDNDRMIGFINGCATDSAIIFDDMFHSTDHHIPSGNTLAVFGLNVIPEYRRQGIAGKLIQEFIETARSAGKKQVILTCKDYLVHYYESFGFVNTGLSASTHGGAQWFDMTCVL